MANTDVKGPPNGRWRRSARPAAWARANGVPGVASGLPHRPGRSLGRLGDDARRRLRAEVCRERDPSIAVATPWRRADHASGPIRRAYNAAGLWVLVIGRRTRSASRGRPPMLEYLPMRLQQSVVATEAFVSGRTGDAIQMRQHLKLRMGRRWPPAASVICEAPLGADVPFKLTAWR